MSNQLTKEFKLIEGQFSPDEAKNILMSLFNNKIDYHQLESFSNQIRLGNDISFSQNRINDLIQSVENIKEMVEEATAKGKRLKIDGIINISFVE